MLPVEVLLGDCIDVLTTIPDASVDAVVTDPPYGLSREPDPEEVLRQSLANDDYTHRGSGFMGRSWDSFVPGPSVWRECLRVLRPGGFLLAFFATRTYDLGTLAVRLAGFEIRDMVEWIYGSGRTKVGTMEKFKEKFPGDPRVVGWEGMSPALAPGHEPIVVARKPFAGPLYQNLHQHGCGALNIDACRTVVSAADAADMSRCNTPGSGRWKERDPRPSAGGVNTRGLSDKARALDCTAGRWPKNLVHDGSEEVEQAFEKFGMRRATYSDPKSASKYNRNRSTGSGRVTTIYNQIPDKPGAVFADIGTASRFFPVCPAEDDGALWYSSKASKRERDAGTPHGNTHPTVKPISLMRWLVRLAVPVGGVVLDPFAGSGTTGLAAQLEERAAILVEMDADSHATALSRNAHLYLARSLAGLSQPAKISGHWIEDLLVP